MKFTYSLRAANVGKFLELANISMNYNKIILMFLCVTE